MNTQQNNRVIAERKRERVYYALVKRAWNEWHPIVCPVIYGSEYMDTMQLRRVQNDIIAKWIVKPKIKSHE